MEYYPAIKKNETMPNKMGPESITRSEVSQRKTNVVWDHSFVESNFLNDTNELFFQNRNRLTVRLLGGRVEGKDT